MGATNGQDAKEVYLATLRAQVERLTALITAVESEGEVLALDGGVTVVATGRLTDSQVRPDSFWAMTTPQATRRFLEMMGKGNPQTPLAIAENLIRGGLDKMENLDAVVKNVYTALKRGQDREFVKVQKEWGLADWYGDRKRPEEKPAKKKRKPKGGKKSSGKPTPAVAEKAANPFKAFNEYRVEQTALGKSLEEIREAWKLKGKK